jgi:hypothetical protein
VWEERGVGGKGVCDAVAVATAEEACDATTTTGEEALLVEAKEGVPSTARTGAAADTATAPARP